MAVEMQEKADIPKKQGWLKKRLSLNPVDAALFALHSTCAIFLGFVTLQYSTNSIIDSYREMSSDAQAKSDQLYIKGDDFRRLARFEKDGLLKIDLEYTGRVDHLRANYNRNVAATWEDAARDIEERGNLLTSFTGLIYGLGAIGSTYHLRSFLRS